MIYDEILRLLADSGLPYSLYKHDAIKSVAEVEEKLPFLLDSLLKTIAFRLRDGQFVLTGLRGQDRLDYRKLAAALAVNRRDVASLSPQEVEAELGFEVGGVGPFALRPEVRLLFDSQLETMDTVYFGSGKNTVTVKMKFSHIQQLTGGPVVALAKI